MCMGSRKWQMSNIMAPWHDDSFGFHLLNTVTFTICTVIIETPAWSSDLAMEAQFAFKWHGIHLGSTQIEPSLPAGIFAMLIIIPPVAVISGHKLQAWIDSLVYRNTGKQLSSIDVFLILLLQGDHIVYLKENII